MPIRVLFCRQDSRTHIGFLQRGVERYKGRSKRFFTFVHLEMGAEFLVCVEGLGAVPMNTLVWLCPRWCMFTSHVGT